ncbi:MAG: C25 family cysteine peptidase, partial [Chloroflexota bacterium]
HVVYRTPVTNTTSTDAITAFYFMNRITIDYDRRFVAEDDQLIFDDDAGSHSYQIEGFSNGTDDDVLVWDISDRLQPVRIAGVEVSNAGPPYTYEFGTDAGPASFIATHAGNVREPLAISKYVGPDLDPAAGAEWVAISHANFLQKAQQLAAYRQQPMAGGFSTHVVDIEDVINQYGYGLPIPAAIRQYMQHALFNWPVAPQHLLLMGDGHINPRQLPCPEEAPDNNQCRDWGTEPEVNFVLTDMVYTDVEVGLNASDYTFSLLVGDDLMPDLAVGRLAVQTAAEAQTIIDKIVHFEATRGQPKPDALERSALFIADNPDSAGDFCSASKGVADTLPPGYVTNTVCMESHDEDHIIDIQTAIHDAVSNPPNGVTFMNYRGHGAVRSWAGNLINLDDPDNDWDPWFNNEPVIILTMNCLDGYFAVPGYEALSEEFLARPNHGSVAHWASTGFGYDFQHDVLHHGFYEGVFDHDLTRIGDAINHAKMAYILQSHHPSQLYSFVLQGDPAMETIATGLRTYLPAVSR